MTTTTITWIPVAERLPDADTLVLVAFYDGEVMDCYYDHTGSQWIDETGLSWDPIGTTHWADMPEGPAAQAVPLTHIQIIELWGNRSDGPDNGELIGFARAIERAHGIAAPEGKK